MDPAIIVLLTLLFGFSPAYIPRGIPKTTAIRSETKASSIVAGIRWTINFSAGSPKINERQRSPWNAFKTKYQYCSETGLSRPRLRITRSISA